MNLHYRMHINCLQLDAGRMANMECIRAAEREVCSAWGLNMQGSVHVGGFSLQSIQIENINYCSK